MPTATDNTQTLPLQRPSIHPSIHQSIHPFISFRFGSVRFGSVRFRSTIRSTVSQTKSASESTKHQSTHGQQQQTHSLTIQQPMLLDHLFHVTISCRNGKYDVFSCFLMFLTLVRSNLTDHQLHRLYIARMNLLSSHQCSFGSLSRFQIFAHHINHTFTSRLQFGCRQVVNLLDSVLFQCAKLDYQTQRHRPVQNNHFCATNLFLPSPSVSHRPNSTLCKLYSAS